MKTKALKAAFPYTIPIFAGFWFLALAYGILMNVNGFSFIYPMLMSLLIYGGSLEFIVVTMLMSPFAPLSALAVTLLVQSRHLFYGIAMLDRFRGMGWKKFYLIFGMCDETFSINYSADFCHTSESALLGFRRHHRRPHRILSKIQHKRT